MPVRSTGSREVGRVLGLWRYPVKSMAAEPLESAGVAWHGLEGDRRWAFVREGQQRSGFPWLTIRENPEMRHYTPWFVDPGNPDASDTMVRAPSGHEFDVTDPALALALGHGSHPIRNHVGVFDTMPLALISAQSVSHLGRMAGTTLEVQRFRPNVLIDAPGDEQFPEDSLVGCTLRIGGMRMRVDKRDKRCVMVNIDPVTSQRNSAILRAIARERDACLGVYGSVVEPGRVAVGDAVVVDC